MVSDTRVKACSTFFACLALLCLLGALALLGLPLLGLAVACAFAFFIRVRRVIVLQHVKNHATKPFKRVLGRFSGVLLPGVHRCALCDCGQFNRFYGGLPLVSPLDTPLEPGFDQHFFPK